MRRPAGRAYPSICRVELLKMTDVRCGQYAFATINYGTPLLLIADVSAIARHGLHFDSGGSQELPNLRGVFNDV